MRCKPALFGLIIAVSACSTPPSYNHSLQMELETVQSQNPDILGFAIYVIDKGSAEVAATGQTSPDGMPMEVLIPVRMASITKTFVAASILRLWEDDLIDLDAPISGHITPDINALLQSDGYDTDNITIRHLLTHSSGMPDHANEVYVERVFANPNKVWMPLDQVEILIETTDPQGQPGNEYIYSDTGYILLGEAIKDVTGLPLHHAVRDLLKIDETRLPTFYWDEVEQPKIGVPERAHQLAFDQDIYAIHGSMDAHGGGGVIASAKDVATFYHLLFGGFIFEQASTLELMTIAPGHPSGSPYRYGIFVSEVAGYDTFQHSGFWGTNVIHVPALNLTISGIALDQSGFGPLTELMKQTIAKRAID